MASVTLRDCALCVVSLLNFAFVFMSGADLVRFLSFRAIYHNITGETKICQGKTRRLTPLEFDMRSIRVKCSLVKTTTLHRLSWEWDSIWGSLVRAPRWPRLHFGFTTWFKKHCTFIGAPPIYPEAGSQGCNFMWYYNSLRTCVCASSISLHHTWIVCAVWFLFDMKPFFFSCMKDSIPWSVALQDRSVLSSLVGDLVLLALFITQHSLLAWSPVKQTLQSVLGVLTRTAYCFTTALTLQVEQLTSQILLPFKNIVFIYLFIVSFFSPRF